MNNFIWYWGARTTQMFVCHKACFSKLLEHFLTTLCVTEVLLGWLLLNSSLTCLWIQLSCPHQKWHRFSATEDLFSDVAFTAVAPLTPHFYHIWKQTNKQTNKQVTVSFRFFILIFCTEDGKMIILTGGVCVVAELAYQSPIQCWFYQMFYHSVSFTVIWLIYKGPACFVVSGFPWCNSYWCLELTFLVF